ncbi:MAG: creatininase family protein [Anaerolineales bacterium]|nr:creatininase family protein [Anaerolineales bacterium]
MQYEELLPAEFNQILQQTPVAYLPWGALEWHGHHMALGNDGLKAHGILKRVAAEAGGVVLPPVWCGYDTLKLPSHGGFPLTLEFKRETVIQLLTEYLEQLSDVGFKLVVVLSGHYGPPHIAALVEAANLFTIWQTQRQTRVWIIPEYDLVTDLGYRGDHAAKWETAILRHLRPELVDLTRLDDQTAGAAGGILGEDPRQTAQPELGARIIEAIVQRLAGRVRRFLEVGHE